jgi:hypothetical protein
VTAKQARLKKEEDEKCTETNSAHCYDHTSNIGIGPIKVSDKFPSAADSVYDYSEVLHKSFIFYFVQRSGKMPYQVCAGNRATLEDKQAHTRSWHGRDLHAGPHS